MGFDPKVNVSARMLYDHQADREEKLSVVDRPEHYEIANNPHNKRLGLIKSREPSLILHPSQEPIDKNGQLFFRRRRRAEVIACTTRLSPSLVAMATALDQRFCADLFIFRLMENGYLIV